MSFSLIRRSLRTTKSPMADGAGEGALPVLSEAEASPPHPLTNNSRRSGPVDTIVTGTPNSFSRF